MKVYSNMGAVYTYDDGMFRSNFLNQWHPIPDGAWILFINQSEVEELI